MTTWFLCLLHHWTDACMSFLAYIQPKVKLGDSSVLKKTNSCFFGGRGGGGGEWGGGRGSYSGSYNIAGRC